MGIKGIWNLLKPVGQPIDLESLRGKTLAVDISFWLHHAKYLSELKGITEHKAAIELVYRRVLKLLHFGIRPIFVFDGPESSIFKLPTLHERKRQREHQVDEKEKRNQNRTIKTLARKALAVQLARDEGRKRKCNETESQSSGDDESDDSMEEEAVNSNAALSSQEFITLSDDDQETELEDGIGDSAIALLMSQLEQTNDSNSSTSVSVVFGGSQHAHVLIRSELQSISQSQGGFCNGDERKRLALDRVRQLASQEHTRNFQHKQANRYNLLPDRLLLHEDERRVSSSDDDFEEVPDVIISTIQRKRSDVSERILHIDSSPSTSATKVLHHHREKSTERIIVERWDAKQDTTFKETNSGGEIVNRCRELLTYFGVPFIDSPAEAEAQCAYMDYNGLTDGTITDDSDAWAFGARTVYRHVFERKKSALEYRANDIMGTFGLGKFHFIALALILGCDFTPGIINVGIVAALEIISTFIGSSVTGGNSNENHFVKKLRQFRRWWEKHHVEEGKPEAPETNAVKRRLRKLNCVFPPSFPDQRIFRIFSDPKVQEMEETTNGKPIFEWTYPDVENLRRLLSQDLGNMKQVEFELADLQRRIAPPDPSQAKLTVYFNAKQRPSSEEMLEHSLSKRLKKACEKLKRRNNN